MALPAWKDKNQVLRWRWEYACRLARSMVMPDRPELTNTSRASVQQRRSQFLSGLTNDTTRVHHTLTATGDTLLVSLRLLLSSAFRVHQLVARKDADRQHVSFPPATRRKPPQHCSNFKRLTKSWRDSCRDERRELAAEDLLRGGNESSSNYTYNAETFRCLEPFLEEANL